MLIDFIHSEGLAAGDRLPSIRELAGRWQVGVTTVRDAVKRGEAMGLLRVHPRSGIFVQAFDYGILIDAFEHTCETSLLQVDHSIAHFLEARRVIESEIVAKAASRRHVDDLLPVREALEAMRRLDAGQKKAEYIACDVRFHVEIARIAGNPVLFTLLKSLLEMLRPYLVSAPLSAEGKHQGDASHLRIYEALLAGNQDAIREEIQQHIDLVFDYLVRQIVRDSAPEPNPSRGESCQLFQTS